MGWIGEGARGLSSYIVQDGFVQAKDWIGILQRTPGHVLAVAVLSVSPIWLPGTALPLWFLLKPIPRLSALKIRNLFICSPTTLSLKISQDFLIVSSLPCVSQ